MPEEDEEAVRVAGDAVTQTVRLAQQAALPRRVGAVLRFLQILLVAEDLRATERNVSYMYGGREGPLAHASEITPSC